MTTSTVITVKTALVALFGAAVDVPVTWAWPGPDTKSEAVFLGFHPQVRDNRTDGRHDVPTIKSARQQRTENYVVPVTIWTFRPDYTSSRAKDVETRAFALMGNLEDVLADDPHLGLATGTIQWAKAGDFSSELHPFDKGWACELVLDVNVQARLI